MSRCQFNAGAWLAAIPSLKKFECDPGVFKLMLQIHMGLQLGIAKTVSECEGCKLCPVDPTPLRNGRHWMTKCRHGWRARVHDALRDEIAAMFKQGLRVPAETEVGNLYSQRRSDNSFRPADVVRHGNGGDQQAAAMDITIGDPTCDSYIALESHKIKLKTAAEKHKHKMDLHRRRVNDLGDVPYVFQPLAFETTGAMGAETQKWWASIVSEDAELRKDRGEPGSRLLCGLPATWAANSFKTFWLQSFAMVQARTQANSIGVWVRKSTPLVGPAHEE